MPSTRKDVRSAMPLPARSGIAPAERRTCTNAPIRIALAIVAKPIRAPSRHAAATTTTATTTFAAPNESGELRATPWWRTSHGGSPSLDSRMRTIPIAQTKSPKPRLARRVARPPPTVGGGTWRTEREQYAGASGPRADRVAARSLAWGGAGGVPDQQAVRVRGEDALLACRRPVPLVRPACL